MTMTEAIEVSRIGKVARYYREALYAMDAAHEKVFKATEALRDAENDAMEASRKAAAARKELLSIASTEA